MNKLENFNSPEKKVLLEVFQKMDNWIASIVENYIYAYVRECHDNGKLKCKYRTKYGEKDGEYNEEGDLIKDEVYHNGEKITEGLTIV